MIYRILVEADKHWGAMSPKKQYLSSYIIKRFLAEFPIDLYVNLGDLYDSKLLLNSKPAIYATRDQIEKCNICAERGIPVRAIRGTRSHDYDQWETFRKFENPGFRIFNELTVEETLPGLKCIYCPDENMSAKEHLEKYVDKIRGDIHNIGFFHGSFDVVLPKILLQLSEDSVSTNLVFEYMEWYKNIQGPMVSGHWHDGQIIDDLIYVGSMDRWSFGEDAIKGFGIVEYDTEEHSYKYLKVPNFFAEEYRTFSMVASKMDVHAINDVVAMIDQELKEHPELHARIRFVIDEPKPSNDTVIESMRYYFSNNKRVSFLIVDEVAKKKKKEKKKEDDQKLTHTYAYVTDKNLSLTRKIRQYIYESTGRDWSDKDIDRFIKRYLDKAEITN